MLLGGGSEARISLDGRLTDEGAEPVAQPAASEAYRCAALFFGERGKEAHRTPWHRPKSRTTSLPERGRVLVLSTTEERKKDDNGKSKPVQDADDASSSCLGCERADLG